MHRCQIDEGLERDRDAAWGEVNGLDVVLAELSEAESLTASQVPLPSLLDFKQVLRIRNVNFGNSNSICDRLKAYCPVPRYPTSDPQHNVSMLLLPAIITSYTKCPLSVDTCSVRNDTLSQRVLLPSLPLLFLSAFDEDGLAVSFATDWRLGQNPVQTIELHWLQ